MENTNTHLAGITVLDLSSLLPAPFAGFLLRQMGARVLKIESPNRPDPARTFGFSPPGKTSSAYRALNSDKEFVPLDLKSPQDREQLYSLVKSSDCLLEGYRPEVRARLGIEYDRLAKLNPKLVYCSMLGYRPSGPHSSRGGHDLNFVARSGVLDQTRDSEGRCIPLGAPIADYISAYSAAFRISAALLSAQRTGRGCHLEVAMEDALIEMQTPFLSEARESGQFPHAGDTLVTGKYPCYRLYTLAEGTLAVGALEAKFWEGFCREIGHPELLSSQFATGKEARLTIQAVEKALAKRSFAEWVKIFERADCCVDPVLSIKDLLRGLQS